MKKLLLFLLLPLGYKTVAQTDSTGAGTVLNPEYNNASVISSDTLHYGHFYLASHFGYQISGNKVNTSGKEEKLTQWGGNIGSLIGFSTYNERFLFETGMLIRKLNTINRISFGGKDLNMIVSSDMTQIPLFVKTSILSKETGKVKLRAITGLNFTFVDPKDYELSGDFEVVSEQGNELILRTRQVYNEEKFLLTRDINTSKAKNNTHLTAEAGLEGAILFLNKFEAGTTLTYQYSRLPLETLKVSFMGNQNLPPVSYSESSRDKLALNLAFFLKYRFKTVSKAR